MKLFLTLSRLLSLAAFALSVQGADLSKYRDFQLGMPLAEVAKRAGTAWQVRQEGISSGAWDQAGLADRLDAPFIGRGKRSLEQNRIPLL